MLGRMIGWAHDGDASAPTVQDIIDGKLTFPGFQVVVFPGGYSVGYKNGLSGYEANVRNFVSAAGAPPCTSRKRSFGTAVQATNGAACARRQLVQ